MHNDRRIRRADAILDAASAAFEELGFEGTRVEEIAERADIAAGTVYNYFTSKEGVILALARRYADETVVLREALVEDPPNDPLLALDSYNAVALDNSLHHLNKPLWRRVLSASFADGGHLSSIVPGLDELLLGQVTRMLQILQNRGRLRAGVDARDLASIALAIQTIQWQRFIAIDEMPLIAVRRIVSRLTRLAIGEFCAATGRRPPKRKYSERRGK
jgi:AcrR family transcriptional regulator